MGYSKMADIGTVKLLDEPQKLVQAIGLPDEHYEQIQKQIKKSKAKEFNLADKSGIKHRFYYEGEQMKARLPDGSVKDVFSLSQVKQDNRSDLAQREALAKMVVEKRPEITDEEKEAAIDILQEGIDTAKRLVSLGVPFQKAKQIVGEALVSEVFGKDDIVRLIGTSQGL